VSRPRFLDAFRPGVSQLRRRLLGHCAVISQYHMSGRLDALIDAGSERHFLHRSHCTHSFLFDFSCVLLFSFDFFFVDLLCFRGVEVADDDRAEDCEADDEREDAADRDVAAERVPSSADVLLSTDLELSLLLPRLLVAFSLLSAAPRLFELRGGRTAIFCCGIDTGNDRTPVGITPVIGGNLCTGIAPVGCVM